MYTRAQNRTQFTKIMTCVSKLYLFYRLSNFFVTSRQTSGLCMVRQPTVSLLWHISMFEMADACEHHGHVMLIAEVN